MLKVRLQKYIIRGEGSWTFHIDWIFLKWRSSNTAAFFLLEALLPSFRSWNCIGFTDFTGKISKSKNFIFLKAAILWITIFNDLIFINWLDLSVLLGVSTSSTLFKCMFLFVLLILQYGFQMIRIDKYHTIIGCNFITKLSTHSNRHLFSYPWKCLVLCIIFEKTILPSPIPKSPIQVPNPSPKSQIQNPKGKKNGTGTPRLQVQFLRLCQK